jgi:pimeloyl-ACP methyl ester carboxylesterase
MRRSAWLATGLAAVFVAVGGYGVSRNPEDQDLDAAAREAAGGQYATLSDGITHYQVAGPADGPPVVLVHGFSVPFYIWDSTVVSLTGAGYRVLRYDLFGRGWSDRPDVRYDNDLFDLQLAELIEAAGFGGSVHLMGLSFGGFVAGTFAGRHPARVRSLTLVDPMTSGFDRPPWFFRLPILGSILWQALVVPGMAEGQMPDFLEPEKWPDWPDRYRTQMRYRGFGRALRSSIMVTSGVSVDSVYATVGRQSFPVQLLWGEEDQTVPIALSEGVRRAIPRIQYHPIPRAGHLPHMERTDLVNPILLDFLHTTNSAAATPGRP